MFSSRTDSSEVPVPVSTAAVNLPSLAEYSAASAQKQSSASSPSFEASVAAWCKAAGLSPQQGATVLRELRGVYAAIGRTLSVEDAELLASGVAKA